MSWLMMMKTSKRNDVTTWSGMACCHQTRRPVLSCWLTGVWNSLDCILVDFWPKVGTIYTAFLLICCTNCHVHLLKMHLVKLTCLLHYHIFFCL